MVLPVTRENLDGLPEAIAAEYKKEDDGTYRLDVSGLEDTGALKRAKEHEKKKRQEAEDTARSLQEQIDTLTSERDDMLKGAVPKGDVDRLEASYKDKLAKREKELNDQLAGLTGQLEKVMVDDVALNLATKLSKSPEVLLPHIRCRLKAEKGDDGYVTKVLDKDGKPSAFNMDDLEKEFRENPSFAPIIIGSKATGSGAAGGDKGGGAPGNFDYSKASTKEIAAHIKQQRENSGGP